MKAEKIHVKIETKPRNRLVALAAVRKAGKHTSSKKSERAKARIWIKQQMSSND